MKKTRIVLFTGLIAGLVFALPVSAQEKSADKKVVKHTIDTTDMQWVEEAAHRALILSEEAARRAEAVSREMEKHAYHRMQEFDRQGKMRMDHRDTMRFKRDEFSVFPDSVEVSRMWAPYMSDKNHFPEIKDLPSMEDFPDVETFGDFRRFGPYHGFVFSDSKSGSSWDYSRRLNEETYTNSYTVTADQAAKKINISVSGNCTKGSINITVSSPDGKKLSDIVIDENGNMNWRKSFKEDENKWTKGSWEFKVTTKNATGNFNISLDSF